MKYNGWGDLSKTRQRLKNKPCPALIAPLDVRLPKHNEADQDIDTVVHPDVLVVCDGSKLECRRCIGLDCGGAVAGYGQPQSNNQA